MALALNTQSISAAPPAANLDQLRNGAADTPVSPADWVNGNAGAETAHYVEGYSIAYRCIMTDLPTNGTSITLQLGYDVRHSGKSAIDYLTAYNRIDAPSHNDIFGHTNETIDPLAGVSGVSSTVTTYTIPAPSSSGSPIPNQPTTSYDNIVASEGLNAVAMTLFGGTITNITYDSQGNLTADAAETTINVTFTVDSSTAILAWGGHIANRADWGFTNGVPNSAGGISGSPYHMRLKGWSLGNPGSQDRSLSAVAVCAPPPFDMGTIYIIGDGSVNPFFAPISTFDNMTYTLTESIKGSIVVQRNNTVIDGAGHTLYGPVLPYPEKGIELTSVSNVAISNLRIESFYRGIYMDRSSNCNITGNMLMTSGWSGIYAYNCSFSTISANNITDNDQGIYFSRCWNNTLVGNTITSNNEGMRVWRSLNNTMRNNTMTNNGLNLWVESYFPQDYVNDIDTSNTVDGKPVYYWVNQTDRTVPLDAGYVGLINCTGITVQNLNLTSNACGVLSVCTNNSTIRDNDITNCIWSIYLLYSANNSLNGNNLDSGGEGIYLVWSSNNTLRNNSMTNGYGLLVDGDYLSDFLNDVDTSNTVDGKPVYYWIDRNGGTVPLDAGFVGLVNCTGITVQNLDTSGINVELAFTTNSTVTNNTITRADYPIYLLNSPDNIVSLNNIADSGIGILLYMSSHNNVTGNVMTRNYYDLASVTSSNNAISGNNMTGTYATSMFFSRSSNNSVNDNDITGAFNAIEIFGSSGNTLFGNDIKENQNGVHTSSSSNNHIYHNNFVNNTVQVSSTNSTNVWDDGYPSGGNYWSDYNGTDSFRGANQDVIGSDGIGDTPYVVDVSNSDRYPLMSQLVRTAAGSNVTVYPEPDVGLTFENVTRTGSASAYKTDVLPEWMPSLPGLVGEYVDVTVTAGYFGAVTIGVTYDDSNMTQEEENSLRLLEWQGCDVTGPTPGVLDGVVNMRDIGLFCRVFMVPGGSEGWEPRCDVTGPTGVPDGTVNMRDIGAACINFMGTNQWEDITLYVDTENNVIYGETSHFSMFGVTRY